MVLWEKEGLIVVSSRIIAEKLNKRHDNIMRDIDNIIKNNILKFEDTILFLENYYTNNQNKQKYREYLITKDGFTLYMFNI